MNPFMALTNEGTITSRLVEEFSKEFDIPKAEITQAAHVAWVELLASRDDIRKKGEETLAYIKEHTKKQMQTLQNLVIVIKYQILQNGE